MVRNVHEITLASCSLSLRERAGVREYKWSSYFMRVPKFIRIPSLKGMVSDHIEIIYLKIYKTPSYYGSV
ncbi:MAG: hypothetical protein RIR39_2681 [Pseudomonadota bacterium]|jgi:hypothetical protein